jgi:transposase InsO family protein
MASRLMERDTYQVYQKAACRLGVKTLFIERGSSWENGYIESFNGKLRGELLDLEIFTTLKEAKVLIEQWRKEYNHIWPPAGPLAIRLKIQTERLIKLSGRSWYTTRALSH